MKIRKKRTKKEAKEENNLDKETFMNEMKMFRESLKEIFNAKEPESIQDKKELPHYNYDNLSDASMMEATNDQYDFIKDTSNNRDQL